MKKFDIELMVGLFMIAGILCLGYLSIKLGKMEVFGSKGYELQATFSNSGGLKVGSGIIIAGVEVGRVKSIALENYQAYVVMNLPSDVKIQEDAIASIRTKGLIGECRYCPGRVRQDHAPRRQNPGDSAGRGPGRTGFEVRLWKNLTRAKSRQTWIPNVSVAS
jgi:phospholipid/cholesterol/gamma-HCH transport system substrate-binding protein